MCLILPHLYVSLPLLDLFPYPFFLQCPPLSRVFPQGEYDLGVKDCDSALKVCKESRRALYRKALCLKELGKYKEAYNCTTDCLLITRLVKGGEEWEGRC